ncbi:MAG TPA: amidase [Caldilineaceae bacterium]|nr:amidase [Caldilineaceae bacterium]
MREMTIAELRNAMTSGLYSARTITQMYLARIEALNRRGPMINAVIEVNPDALDIAAALDAERHATGARGPLHGIPILLKDNIDTADKMMTTAGSLALEGNYAAQDAFVTQKLREAGAILLGKTNLSEWANFRSTRSSSGWSSRGGRTRNPYALDRNPSGSSSGSGAAVAANFCAVAIGTETDGSIVSPASMNGIVGFKPTVGLVSRSGIIPIAHTQDTAGPMARTVADAALVLSALAGIDPRDEMTAASAGHAHTDYTQFLDKDGLHGMRIGIARDFCGFHERVDAIVEESIAALQRAGAVVVDPVEIKTAKVLREPEWQTLQYEFKADLNKYLANVAPDVAVHSLADVIAFNNEHRERVMPYFGQELHIMSQEKGPLESEEYQRLTAEKHRLARDEGIDATLREHRLDAIMAPSNGPAWVTDLIGGDRFLGGSSGPAAVAGYPNITVPAGYVYGMPINVSFFAGAWQDGTILRIAYAFEQATMVRRPPQFRQTAV